MVNTMLSSPQPMFLAWGPDLFSFYNDAYAEFLGPRWTYGTGMRFPELWSDVWNDIEPIVANALAGDGSLHHDLPLTVTRHGTPEPTWWTFSYSPVRDENDKIVGMFCVTNETTKQVQGQAAADARENRNRQILDSATDYAVVATDLDGRITRWNEGARRTLGWTEEEMLGEQVDRFFTPEDVAGGRPQIEMQLAIETGSGTDERWHQRKGGERFWANGEVTPLKGEDGNTIGFVKVLRDRTEQRLSDEALRHSQADLATALEDLRFAHASLEVDAAEATAERDHLWDTSPDLLMVTSPDGVIQAANPAWADILGWNSAEVENMPITDLVHPDDLGALPALLANLALGPISAVENRYRHKDGSYRWISWVAAPAEEAIYATGRHITAEKEAQQSLRLTEEALRQSQKVEAVGQLTGGVAHDFNNLLTVIRGSVDLLRRPGVSEEKRLRYIDAIADTADRAAKLTGQLLAFARRQALTPEIFDAAQNVVALRDMMGTITGSRIEVAIDAGHVPHPINADRSQFDTAIVNMAVNARDAMKSEGRLSIRVGRVSGMPAVRSHSFIPGDFVAVALTDTGSGIAADKIDRIFEPFFTTKGVGEGTGLGLSQVFGFAKQSGGDIIVESREGEGATFTLYLPLAVMPDKPEVGADASDLPMIGEGACVLVVEDNAEVGTFATQALSQLGYKTRLAVDAASALAVLAKGCDGFDVVFSDVVMPGMSGIELGQEIRRLYPRLPVILTSGYSTVLAQNGAHGFELLHKPYAVDKLARTLRKVSDWRRRS
jgi:PAS domain S-box-containing protein